MKKQSNYLQNAKFRIENKNGLIILVKLHLEL